MPETSHSRVLSIDDDAEIRDLVAQVLGIAGYDVISAPDGPSGIRAAREQSPGLILLDIMMPGMNGYRVCDELQTDKRTSNIPVVFLTALSEQRDRARAFALGATDYLTKPFNSDAVVKCVERNLATSSRFHDITEIATDIGRERVTGSDFMRFKTFLLERLPDNDRVRAVVMRMGPADMYAKAASAGIDASDLAVLAAEFLGLERAGVISPDSIDLGVLPAPFCRSSLVIPIRTPRGRAFVVANPFDLELQELIGQYSGGDNGRLIVAEPRTVLSVLGAVRLDTPRTSQEPVSPGADSPASMERRRLDILVVDDDPDAQAVTARMIESAGHGVTLVSEGASALVHLARRRFDLVLADIEMPTLGGFALLDVMRKQGLMVPVVFVTGSTTPEDEAVAVRMGAVDFVRKPVSKEALLGSVARAAAHITRQRGVA
jgi:CheY-like chemotaxis protein